MINRIAILFSVVTMLTLPAATYAKGSSPGPKTKETRLAECRKQCEADTKRCQLNFCDRDMVERGGCEAEECDKVSEQCLKKCK